MSDPSRRHGGATPSSTRSTSAASPTPTATASATCPGITSRLPYLRDLGVDALWITPFYPSPQHDHGYDVADYCDVDPLFGTLADADALIAAPTSSACRSSSTWCPTTPRASTRGSRPRSPRARAAPSGRATCSATGKGRDGDSRPTTGARSSAARPGPGCPTAVVPPPLRHHPARPRLAQPRGRRHVRGRAALLARPRRRRLPGRRGARPVQGGEPARPGRRREGQREPAERSAARATPWSSAPLRDEPMWDQPEVHDVYRRWHRVLGEYDGDRMAVAEAWTQTPESMARYVRPDELQPGVQLLLAARAAGRRAPSPSVITRHARGAVRRSAPRRPGCSATTTSSGTPRGTAAAPVGLARARAATLAMLALPGSAYLYQGEELGLEQVDVAPEERGRTRPGSAPRELARRLPGADPVVGRRAAVRLRPGHRPALAPAAGRLGRPLGRPPRNRTRTRRWRSTGPRWPLAAAHERHRRGRRAARRRGRRAGLPPGRADRRAQRRHRAGRAAGRRGGGRERAARAAGSAADTAVWLG